MSILLDAYSRPRTQKKTSNMQCTKGYLQDPLCKFHSSYAVFILDMRCISRYNEQSISTTLGQHKCAALTHTRSMEMKANQFTISIIEHEKLKSKHRS